MDVQLRTVSGVLVEIAEAIEQVRSVAKAEEDSRRELLPTGSMNSSSALRLGVKSGRHLRWRAVCGQVLVRSPTSGRPRLQMRSIA
ncbi:hypothetical protein [Frigoribacterium sp. VKM Ac-2836]|uniref:hypothetical protein n=1 Tax=Frigoribacterium sp. VKM Ac-2836 TaxID=2739014 RepID=UPI0015647789|nr:hypothetical protein [Frigoribacterium sp. VKM Ac-2836]NRD26184.1 hypothetical protein [Frigoribacterium sp. VKM Ac-2836]